MNATGKDVMEFTKFVRRPFIVEAVEVTKENISEVATLVGELRYKDGDQSKPYIQVNRWIVPNVLKVWPGFWVTKMGDNVRCYSRRVFNQEFTPTTPEIERWVEYITAQTLGAVSPAIPEASSG